MTRAFLQVAIPVLYVYDEGEVPTESPGFDMGMLPVVSRVLKDHAGTDKVTVITGAPAPSGDLPSAFTHLALQYANLKKASPEAGHLLAAEFVADNFDAEKVLKHLEKIVEERQRELAEQVEGLTSKRAKTMDVDVPEDLKQAGKAPDVEELESMDAAAGGEEEEEDEDALETDEDDDANDDDGVPDDADDREEK